MYYVPFFSNKLICKLIYCNVYSKKCYHLSTINLILQKNHLFSKNRCNKLKYLSIIRTLFNKSMHSVFGIQSNLETVDTHGSSLTEIRSALYPQTASLFSMQKHALSVLPPIPPTDRKINATKLSTIQGGPNLVYQKVNACFSATSKPILMIYAPNESQCPIILSHQVVFR